MTDVRESERSEGKVARTPMGGLRLKLQLSKEDRKEFDRRRMVPHWFNDDPGRLEQAQAGGYKFVHPDCAKSLGEGVLHRDGNDPSSNVRVSVVVGRSDPIQRAYLMEIPLKFYEEDQAAKEAKYSLVDEALALGGKGASDVENVYKPK